MSVFVISLNVDNKLGLLVTDMHNKKKRKSNIRKADKLIFTEIRKSCER